MGDLNSAALVLNAPRTLAFEPLLTAPLASEEVRIKTLYSGVSAGTELSQYRGTNTFMHRQWNASPDCSGRQRPRVGRTQFAIWATKKLAKSSKLVPA